MKSGECFHWHQKCKIIFTSSHHTISILSNKIDINSNCINWYSISKILYVQTYIQSHEIKQIWYFSALSAIASGELSSTAWSVSEVGGARGWLVSEVGGGATDSIISEVGRAEAAPSESWGAEALFDVPELSDCWWETPLVDCTGWCCCCLADEEWCNWFKVKKVL